MNVDGSGVRKIGGGFAPAWSPDGQELAFVKIVQESCAPFDTVSRIYAVKVDGTGERRVTPLGGRGQCRADDYQPDWQPRCTKYGTTRADDLVGTSGRDIVCALRGSDTIRAGEKDDVVIGGDGRDTIEGGSGRDWLFGSAGDDLIQAGDGEADVVSGGSGRDRAQIDAGLDRVSGVETLLK